jgi:intraflagellar transport protein 172
VVFGLAEGKVKIGQLRSNKAATLYGNESYCVSLTHNIEGTAIISGHVDGSIIRYFFQDERGTGPTQQKLTQHSCVPSALAWGKTIVAAGADQRVVFYDSEGGQCGQFDYDGQEDVKEFCSAVANPTGETVILGNFNSFHIFNFNAKKDAWDEVGVKHINNYYSVTALAFKPDGSRLAVGNLCGAVDTFDACIRRYRYANAFELTYVALSQVIVKRLATGSRVVVKSSYNCEIAKIDIFQDRYLVAHTDSTLLLGDLETCKLSEIRWGTGGQGNEKFVFDSLNVCIVFCAGELSLIEYGSNEILGQVRTEYISGHLLSVRINERPPRGGTDDPDTPRQDEKEGENKKIAYLLDANTVSVKDLHNHGSIEVQHDCKVDWLELNERANLLLFRDRRRQLHIYNCDTNQRNSLLNYCNYVQWVPNSDVVVAQNRSNMNVWYNIMAPEDVTVYPIKGDIEEIERANGKTEVIVDEGMTTSSYQLDEGLIAFGTAIDDRDYSKATDILEDLDLTPETRAMWSQLSEDALSHHQFEIAERCAAALGDIGMCRFLRKSNKLARQAKEEMQIHHALDFWAVKARFLLLKKNILGAEEVYLNNGKTEEAIDMYNALHRYEDAIKVADSRDLPQAADMRDKYYSWLLESGQEEVAAALKEREGDVQAAISLYLKGGRPAKAAEVVKRHKMNQPQLLQQIATALTDAGMHDKAGDFYVKLNQEQRGLQSYIDGKAFPQAIKLAREAFPQEIIRLEEMYGDYLVSQKQVDMAINHYIEAGVQSKAIEAALNSRQWSKVVNLLEAININEARPYHRRLARHYQEAGQLEQAEQHFINAAVPSEAVEMYTRLNKWESAHKVAITYMTEQEVQRLYINQATRKEALGQLKEAEQLYMTVNEPDLAINMYKKAQRYDQMVRLVSKHRKDLIKDTHVHLAQQLEMEGNLKEAENHYAEAGEWMSAVNMYRSNDLWDEAIRVAKFHGGVNASKRVAYAWALALGGDEGSKLLTKLGLIEPAIEYAVESGAFDHAYKLAEASLPKKLPEVYLKHALFLEDEERFKEAEDKFVKADKPKEAIDMYIHQQDWQNAMRVADQYDPSSVSDVYVAQAKTALERKEHPKAEQLYLTANKPDLALAMYIEAKMWQDARRVAKRHLPHKLNDVNLAYQRSASSEGSSKVNSPSLSDIITIPFSPFLSEHHLLFSLLSLSEHHHSLSGILSL